MIDSDFFIGPEDIVENLQKNILKTYAQVEDQKEIFQFITKNLSTGQFCNVDQYGNTAFHLIAWNPKKRFYHPAGRWHDITEKCKGCEANFHSLRLASSILSKCPLKSDVLQIIFHHQNPHGVTPFMLACASGCDTMIVGFLSLLKDGTIVPIKKLIDPDGNNVLHYIMNSSGYHMNTQRHQTLRILLEKLPQSSQLVSAKNIIGLTPLQMFLRPNFPHWPEVIQLIRIMLENGANPDVVNSNGDTFLCMSIKNVELVELLLRCGCDPNQPGRDSYTPLSRALCRQWRVAKRPCIRVIELLLAYGIDLKKETYIRDICSAENVRNIGPEVWDALWNVYESNQLISLKRLCRTAIRRRLKWKADKVISEMNDIPETLVSFLLLQDEPKLLGLKD